MKRERKKNIREKLRQKFNSNWFMCIALETNVESHKECVNENSSCCRLWVENNCKTASRVAIRASQPVSKLIRHLITELGLQTNQQHPPDLSDCVCSVSSYLNISLARKANRKSWKSRKMFHVNEEKAQNVKLIINWTRLKIGAFQYRQTLEKKIDFNYLRWSKSNPKTLLNI